MIEIVGLPFEEIERLVYIAFRGDEDLINKYHIMSGNFEKCVRSTVDAIKDVADNYPLKFYKVVNDGTDIGFVTLGTDFLHSFGINIKYRTKEMLSEWWDAVMSINKYFFCTLHKKNERAIEYLKNRGMVIFSENDSIINLISKECQ